MGFNTNITICNDNLSDYELRPERFARIICGGALKPYESTEEWGITVVPSEHADATQLVAAGGNFATKVFSAYYVGSHHTEKGQINLLRQWADSLGYRISKKPEGKRS